ncbi:6-bladed beta-propeller [Parabacteroides bouchesdurhonensis]|uniref:6-bladed beta-propeller n=1 Tax=Parabacteroides bouchesdurhonensis TaxID=1936995 RepID=UPI000C864525|nr:6-bladed beta-propeller [Parabacteroides bouchesdurhonensis]
MMTSLKSFSLLAAIAVFSACGEAPQVNYLENAPVVATRILIDGEELIEMDPALLKDTVFFPISHFTEDLHIIKLGEGDEALTGADAALVSDNYILTIGSGNIPYKLFDKQGHYLNDIGAVGQGPGEYRFIYTARIDEENRRIYMMPFFASSLLVYDLEGNSLPSVPLVHKGVIAMFVVQGNKLVVMASPQPQLPSCVWVQDMAGNLLYDITTSFDFDFRNTMIAVSLNEEDHIDLSYWTHQPRVDSLYYVDLEKKKLIPRFTTRFKGDALKQHMYMEWPGYYLGDTSTLSLVSTTDDDGNVLQRQEGEAPDYYIVDKKTLKGAYIVLINDFFGGERFESPLVFQYQSYSVCVDPGVLTEWIDKALKSGLLSDKMRKKLIEVQANMSENDNNYLLYAKLKKPN